MKMKIGVFSGGFSTIVFCVGVNCGALMSGCASMNHEPQSPDENSEDRVAANSAQTEPEPTGDASETNSTEAAETQSTGEAASSDDFQQALQVVIQDEALLNELKLGEPGRFPLKIAGSSVDSGLKLQAHSEAVQVVSAPADAKAEPVLVFTDIELDAKQGMFKYRYEIEGVRGTSYVFKNSVGVWELKSSRVSEY